MLYGTALRLAWITMGEATGHENEMFKADRIFEKLYEEETINRVMGPISEVGEYKWFRT